ncbi:hypothetical protein FB451DRAFT_1194948 [Mycena latifolia]|nr:hypothetical protein FB451DRAFT_1194948 [Mycena latifolia]
MEGQGESRRLIWDCLQGVKDSRHGGIIKYWKYTVCCGPVAGRCSTTVPLMRGPDLRRNAHGGQRHRRQPYYVHFPPYAPSTVARHSTLARSQLPTQGWRKVFGAVVSDIGGTSKEAPRKPPLHCPRPELSEENWNLHLHRFSISPWRRSLSFRLCHCRSAEWRGGLEFWFSFEMPGGSRCRVLRVYALIGTEVAAPPWCGSIFVHLSPNAMGLRLVLESGVGYGRPYNAPVKAPSSHRSYVVYSS